MNDSNTTDFKKSVCLGCSLCCDDVSIKATQQALQFAGGICELGKDWYRRQRSDDSCSLAGRRESLSNAVRAAASFLRSARNPLFCGMNHLSLAESQQLTRLAWRTRGTIDIGIDSPAFGKSEAFRQLGQMTASLGQLAAAMTHGLLIDWQPESSHPRFLGRFGSALRSMWRIEVQEYHKPSAGTNLKCNDHTIPVSDHSQLLTFLRMLDDQLQVTRLAQTLDEIDSTSVVSSSKVLLEDLNSAGCIGVMVGAGPAKDKLLTEQITRLVTTLNEHVKTYLVFAPDSQTTGAESVLTWTFGFPAGINLNSGEPSWNRDEFSAETTLRRRNADCLLACGNDPALMDELLSLAGDIPVIALHSCQLRGSVGVSIAVQQCGWDGMGDWMRMDEMVLRVDPVIQSERPSLNHVLQLLERDLS